MIENNNTLETTVYREKTINGNPSRHQLGNVVHYVQSLQELLY